MAKKIRRTRNRSKTRQTKRPRVKRSTKKRSKRRTKRRTKKQNGGSFIWDNVSSLWTGVLDVIGLGGEAPHMERHMAKLNDGNIIGVDPDLLAEIEGEDRVIDDRIQDAQDAQDAPRCP